MPPPSHDQIKSASKDVAWEYATLLGSAREMTKGHGSPLNHLVQEAFLAHVRNLAEFFREGVSEFRKAQTPPGRPRDNIYAVDFCLSVGWQPKAFGYDRRLIKAINKTLSHMTYSRDRASKSHAHFEGCEHLHGTVTLMRRTWGDFLKSMNPEFLQPKHPEDIPYWLDYHTRNWEVKFNDFENEFDARVKALVRRTEGPARRGILKWMLNQTPDGSV